MLRGSGFHHTRRLASFAALILSISLAANAQQNDWTQRIRARAGLTSNGDIDATGQTIRGNGLLQALEVRQATDGNPVTIGQPGLGQIQIYITRVGEAYEAEIRSTTNIPLRLNGGSDQVKLLGGAAITGGTTNVNGYFEVNQSPVRIVAATGTDQGLQMSASASNEKGLRVYLDTAAKTINFDNTLTGAAGFAFSPALSNLPGASGAFAVYANNITIAATNTTYLLNYINSTMYSLAWDRLLNEASTTTIADYVLNVSQWIMTHFEHITNSTGTTIPDYIDNRIASYLASATALVLPGTLTVGALQGTKIVGDSIHATGGLFASGTVTFAPGTTFINPPTQTVDLTLVNLRLDMLELLSSQNYDDIQNLEAAPSDQEILFAVTDTVTPGTDYYEYQFIDWDDRDSTYYDRAWGSGFPIVRAGVGSEYTNYVTNLEGAVVAASADRRSTRGFRIYLAEGETFSHAWEIRIFGKLIPCGGMDKRDLWTDGGGIMNTGMTLMTKRISAVLRRR
ncbi:MAG: hypothetical protein AB1656_05155 [Candidatus Omnitrophota bacterium]